ncbi:methylmalonyl Co-A mutase-associated GTPase MeaB [Adhaeribacter radiodurans]|uniref:Methylmalonyl Co-A mutase-associated GTPase MeaB n=1 Tax=Adhaeribacter radiodurans TaxID=2745197 RepID=A0A7L7L7S1_9BACT|nr:methylmalonyl Co-A mutase-associated GTPase MeaB [Adhaeribacter radiodurans]QMU28891.1 methylmalonyl Co-A mutase-associated GTPase MeaB [Adhaeribacter radiodurans]
MVKRFYVDQYVDQILAGNRVVLSRAITLVESKLPADQELAQQVINRLLPYSGNSIRIGITGAPGVGKSTFIEALGNYLILKEQKKLAVLAIDPTSQRTGGSILGDKTRMPVLATQLQAYIRPSPAGNSLGGVACYTRESILLCEAAGFEVIFVETVGVGQSETAVHSLTDFFLLLLLAGAGDELQGLKKGIMEMADALIITKADGSNLEKARVARAEYINALHLFPVPPSGWQVPVQLSSALENTGISEVWKSIQEYAQKMQKSKYWQEKRNQQHLYWFRETIRQTLEEKFFAHPEVAKHIKEKEQQVISGQLSAFAAAQELLNLAYK